MKKTIFFYFLLCTAYSQSQSLFNKIYPKPDWDYSTAVIETNENSYLIASSSRSQFNSDYDILLMNIDTTGNIIWEKYLGQYGQREFASNISKTNDGGYIIGGSYRQSGNYDTYVLKVDSIGGEIWSQRLNPLSIAEDGFSAFENASGEYVMIGSGDIHTHIYNISNSGNLNWTTLFDYFTGKQIKQTSDGGYAVIGGIDSRSYNQIVLAKTNKDGDLLWSKQLGGEEAGYARAFTITPDDGFLIAAGGAYQNIGDSSTWSCFIRTDSNGDTLWTKKHQTGSPLCIQNTIDGGYIYSSSHSANDLSGMLIVKADSLGAIEWHNSFDNKYIYRPGNNLHVLNNGGYLLTGHILDGGIADVFLIKIDAEGNFVAGINQLNSNNLNFEVYPNPTKDKVTISLIGVSHPDKVEVQLYDEFGKLIKTFRNVKSGFLEFGINELNPGIYFIKLFGVDNEKKNLVKKLVIVE